MVEETNQSRKEPQVPADAGMVSSEAISPYDLCVQGHFGSYADFSKANTTSKIKNSNNSTISSLKASRTVFQAFQYKPLLKFLDSVPKRLLIADEVGLGKTIEAGHIMLELKARGELGNVLIVCPKSLQGKWMKEMDEKFDLQFKVYEKNADLFRDLDKNDGQVLAIIGYEWIRMRKDYDTKREFDTEDPVNLTDYLVKHTTRFSLVICDEAHRMRNRSTQTYRGAQILMSRADAAVFMTATPIMTCQVNYYNLLHLLDPNRYEDIQVFGNLLQESVPFVGAMTMVNNNRPLPEIKAWLESREVHVVYCDQAENVYKKNETVAQIFAGNPLYDEIITLLIGRDTPDVRAKLLQRLDAIRPTSDVLTRTRKREVTTDMTQPERKAHLVSVTSTKEEDKLAFDIVWQYLEDTLPPTKMDPRLTIEQLEERLSPGARLGLMQIKRQLASNVHAYASTWEDLEKGTDAFAESVDSKVDKLIELIEGRVRAGGERKIVVFAIFRKTLEYLRIRLRNCGYNSLVIHGGVDERDRIIDRFRNDPSIHVLLASEVVGEGLDLEFCSAIVNCDLPWNPMVVEQRIGRIDRFGQKSPLIHIYNIVTKHSIQEQIYDRLYSRIHLFEWNIGEVEQILDIPIYNGLTIGGAMAQYESMFYCGELSEEDVLRKVDEIAIAIENLRQSAGTLNAGLEESHSYDAYFRDQVDKILTGHSSLDRDELRAYLGSALESAIPGLYIEDRDDGTCGLYLPLGNPTALVSFLRNYQPADAKYVKVFDEYISEIEGRDPLVITFDQETALANKDVAFVNMFHPITVACVSYNDSICKTSPVTFSLSFPYGPARGIFYLALYEMTECREVYGASKTSKELFPVLYDTATGAVITDRVLTEEIYNWIQGVGTNYNPEGAIYDKTHIMQLQSAVEKYVAHEVESRQIQLSRIAASSAMRRTARTKEYYEAIIHNRQRAIELWKRVLQWSFILTYKERKCLMDAISITEANIRLAEKEKDERLDNIKPGDVTVTPRLLWLSLIRIEDTFDDRPDKAVF